MKTIGFDAKRIVRNGTGLGSYSRTLINSLSALPSDMQLRLYTPDMGRDDLRQQIKEIAIQMDYQIKKTNISLNDGPGTGNIGILIPSRFLFKS